MFHVIVAVVILLLILAYFTDSKIIKAISIGIVAIILLVPLVLLGTCMLSVTGILRPH